MRIRSHLLVVAFGVVLPVAAFSVFVTTLLVEREQRTFAEGSIERLRSTMSAVDAQVQGQVTALKVLAASRSLDRGDLEGFQQVSSRVLGPQDTWSNLILTQLDGLIVVNVAAPWRVTDKAYLVERDLVTRVIGTQGPVVGSVMMGPGTRRRGINVAVPVIREGAIKYVLIAFVRPELFLLPLEKQRLGTRWVSGLVDANGTFIARVPPPPMERASASFLAAVQREPEGWYRGSTAEGHDAFTAYVTSPVTHWSIGLGIPAEEVLAGARRTAWAMSAGILASLALAGLLALYLGRRATRSVSRLAEAAPAIANGTPIDAVGLDEVNEVQTVAMALNDAAAAVRERQALLEREKRALEESDRAKDEFIAMMSHELRNPLAALSSASHLLERVDPNSPAAKHARDVIKRQTKHTARLIEDLLDVSRVVMGKAYLQLEVFNLADAAASVYETWRSSGRFDRHRVEIEVQAAWIRADRSRVEQIIANLLDNALKFTPDGSAIRVIVSSDDAHAQLEVTDEGPGLSLDLMERVFDVFVQGPQGLARKAGGMGIGLALVKRLTEVQGGTVGVSSSPGAGATFRVRLPAVRPVTTSQAPAKTERRAKPRRIVVIDDNEDMRKTVAATLALQGHHIYEAPDGRSGLRLVGEVTPEIVIVDIGLPDIDGYEVAKRLRANGNGVRIGLVALTGYGQEQDRTKAAAAGFDKHLVKPVDPEVLDQAISEVSTD